MGYKIFNIFIAAASAAVLFAGCAGRGGGNATAPQSRPFPLVQVPGVVAAEQDAAVEYAAEHYWDVFISSKGEYVCDSSLVHGVKKTDVEEAFANWLGLLSNLDISRAKKDVSMLYSKAEACESADTASNVFETMTGLVEKYLYDPNSPLRNEDLYGVYAKELSLCGRLEQLEREKYAREAALCSLNGIGTPAADFEFSDKRGVTRRLYDIRADYTLLFFSNPGCKACKEIIETLTKHLLRRIEADDQPVEHLSEDVVERAEDSAQTGLHLGHVPGFVDDQALVPGNKIRGVCIGGSVEVHPFRGPGD